MVSIVLTTAIGAVLNAGTFIGGSYLAKSLTGKNQDEERKRHDLAVEKYNNDYNLWKKQMGEIELWQEEQEKLKSDASHKFANTDDALKLYAQVHPSSALSDEPNFHDYYTPSSNQRNGEVIFTGLTVVGLVYTFSKYI